MHPVRRIRRTSHYQPMLRGDRDQDLSECKLSQKSSVSRVLAALSGILADRCCIDAGALSEAWATVEDSDDLDTFQPHIIHAPHKPFPIAMTSRKPHGSKFLSYPRYLCASNGSSFSSAWSSWFVRFHSKYDGPLLNLLPSADIRNPQNAAWLAACRYAKRKIWM